MKTVLFIILASLLIPSFAFAGSASVAIMMSCTITRPLELQKDAVPLTLGGSDQTLTRAIRDNQNVILQTVVAK